jgi:hypothetical protein
MGRWPIALLAASIALVAASARAQSDELVLTPTVFATHGLPANAVTVFTASCQTGYIATNAGIAKPASGTTLIGVAPVGRRSYRFRFGNPVTNTARRVTVAVACRRLSAAGKPDYTLELRPLAPKRVLVGAHQTARVPIPCRPGTVPGGSGLDLDAGGSSGQAYRAAPRLAVLRQVSTLTGFFFIVSNAGSRPRPVAFSGGCVTLARASGAAPERLHLALRTFHVAVFPGKRTFVRRCRAGTFSVAAGFSLHSAAVRADGAAVIGSGARWTLESDATGPTLADLQLTCGSLAP